MNLNRNSMKNFLSLLLGGLLLVQFGVAQVDSTSPVCVINDDFSSWTTEDQTPSKSTTQRKKPVCIDGIVQDYDYFYCGITQVASGRLTLDKFSNGAYFQLPEFQIQTIQLDATCPADKDMRQTVVQQLVNNVWQTVEGGTKDCNGTVTFVINASEAVSVRFINPNNGGIYIQNLRVMAGAPIPQAEIKSFSFREQTCPAVIDNEAATVHFTVPCAVDRTNLIPEYTVSSGASIVCNNDDPYDFSHNMIYTVTNGNLSKNWTVIIDCEDVEVYYSLMPEVEGFGQVKLFPSGGKYEAGTVVTVIAEPFFNSVFSGWSGDLSGTNLTEKVIMDASKSIKAVFSGGEMDLDFEKCIGFASVPNSDYPEGTVGGKSGITVYIKNMEELSDFLLDRMYRWKGKKITDAKTNWGTFLWENPQYQPYILILAPGTYSNDGGNPESLRNDMLDVKEHSSITIQGSRDVKFLGVGIQINKAQNIVVRNITFECIPAPGDGINVDNGQHIWIDHCTFWDGPGRTSYQELDGAVDIKNGSNYCTVSFCKFMIHRKTCLLGHTDKSSVDVNKLKTTYYMNFWDATFSRHPRVRYADCHILNNYYNNVGLGIEAHPKEGCGTGAAACCDAQLYIENNFYRDTRWPMFVAYDVAKWKEVYGTSLDSPSGNIPGPLVHTGNVYDDTNLTKSLEGIVNDEMLNPSKKSIKFDGYTPESKPETFTFNPSDIYSYYPYPADVVPQLTTKYSGADKIKFPDYVSAVNRVTLGNTSLQIYPSPATDYIQVVVPFSGLYEVRILSVSGMCLYQKRYGESTIQIDLSSAGIMPGCYWIQIISKNMKYQKKFLVK